MAYDFPASPTENQEFTPPGGPTYVYKAPRWTAKPAAAVVIPPGTTIADAAPASPQHGSLWWESDTGNTYIYYIDPSGVPGQWIQVNVLPTAGSQGAAAISDGPPTNPVNGTLWFESDTGTLFIYYDDGNTSQWVQAGGITGPKPPMDGNEYVMVNGLWRLKEQSINLVGLNAVDIPVPSWAEEVEITAVMYTPVNNYLGMRISGDGTTFATTGYYYLGPTHRTGSSLYGTVAATATGYINVVNTPDVNVDLGSTSKTFMNLIRNTSSNYFIGKQMLHSYASNAAYIYITNWWTILAGEGAAMTQLRIAALRFFAGGGVFGAGTLLKLRWS